jgi:hypothetical protein
MKGGHLLFLEEKALVGFHFFAAGEYVEELTEFIDNQVRPVLFGDRFNTGLSRI